EIVAAAQRKVYIAAGSDYGVTPVICVLHGYGRDTAISPGRRISSTANQTLAIRAGISGSYSSRAVTNQASILCKCCRSGTSLPNSNGGKARSKRAGRQCANAGYTGVASADAGRLNHSGTVDYLR